MTVQELMNTKVITVEPTASTALAARLLSRYNVGALPVCTSDKRLRGIVTPATLTPSQDVHAAAMTMAAHQVRRLPVVENSKLVGIVSLGDLAKSHRYDMEAAQALSEISENIVRK